MALKSSEIQVSNSRRVTGIRSCPGRRHGSGTQPTHAGERANFSPLDCLMELAKSQVLLDNGDEGFDLLWLEGSNARAL